MAKESKPTKAAPKAAPPKKAKPKGDTEAQRLKKEEQGRNVRRRNRQFIGLALSILVIVGAVSIVMGGINLVRSMLDTSGQYEEYQRRFEPFVWFDVLPFESVTLVDENVIKQVCLWGVYNMKQYEEVDTGVEIIQRTERGEALIPAIEVDQYGVQLFGPGFRFSGHASFADTAWDLSYMYSEETQMYSMPATGLDPRYLASVKDVQRESGGVRRVVMGYVSTRTSDNQVVQQLDLDHPAKYMDFVLQRDGNNYYLQSIRNNATLTGGGTPAASIPPQASLPDYSVPDYVLPTSSAPASGEDPPVSSGAADAGDDPESASGEDGAGDGEGAGGGSGTDSSAA